MSFCPIKSALSRLWHGIWCYPVLNVFVHFANQIAIAFSLIIFALQLNFTTFQKL